MLAMLLQAGAASERRESEERRRERVNVMAQAYHAGADVRRDATAGST
jgi:hypothetical protein